MNNKKIYILRGIGIGFILASIVFFMLQNTLVEETTIELTKDELIEQAYELGMVEIGRIDEVYLTEDEVIAKAKELGMEFK